MRKVYFKGETYPKFQSEGFASQFAFPYATKLIEPERKFGFDVGCMNPKWAFPHAQPIDLSFDDEWDALHLPSSADYIFSSHMLEHVPNWVDVLDYWTHDILVKPESSLFLYLPDYSQVYWRPWNNRKHIHIFTPQILRDYLTDRGYTDILISGVDLNNAFMVYAEKSNEWGV